MIIRIAIIVVASFAIIFAIGPPPGISRPAVYALDRATTTPATPQPSVILPTPTDYPAGYPAPETPTAYAAYPPPLLIPATPIPPAPVYVLLLPIIR